MGLFQISPVDKGGKLFRPSQDVVSLVGRELTPIAFALLYGWKEIGFHTTSVGVARKSDLDEVLQAARMMALSNSEGLYESAKDRLNERAVERLGAEWDEKGLVNLPSMLDESTDGIAIGHILWLYNLLVNYGMYEFCHDRYSSLVHAPWNKKKSFQENADAM
jgi:predicted aldo/keto reductase-like oxidoreductase